MNWTRGTYTLLHSSTAAEYVLGMHAEDGDHGGELVPLVFDMPADIVVQDQDQQQ
jgi:hypothetical protein